MDWLLSLFKRKPKPAQPPPAEPPRREYTPDEQAEEDHFKAMVHELALLVKKDDDK
jgi:hypothetical protein